MIIRVWTCPLKKGAEKAFEEFAVREAAPLMRKTEGCLDAYFGIDFSSDPAVGVVVSLWRDIESIKSFTGGNWREPFIHPTEEPLLAEKPKVMHFDLIGKL
ncbi:MAG: antibiotic biosynthesis monooxygenase [Candidatus Caldarchaeum sp.]|nr:antibiotic biosynthesis monooxygenase [Candidatus Caldarchaeum sp.]MCX8201147.1 antibiotic biosynthesis monooxygenase [Candidatus Caldarchaeum sp.]MDW8063055.1 antibiotic biosynthesis monooxygenase [Candidatus Caldarchaeum sp.]MDW8434710.1 antibiotic biosynthesis monooxygenase [Candidatus Caldarchaeum sp.]